MNSKLRFQFFVSLMVAIVLSFGAGYATGNDGFLSFSKSTQASEQVNLEPFWKVWNALDEKFVSASSTKTFTDEEKLYGAISGLVNSLGDPYTVFLTPEDKAQFDESISGVFEGVGMEVGIQDDYLVVVTPLKNSPAEKAGIQKQDKIVSINGKDASGLAVDEAVALIRGPKGTVVTLEVLGKDDTAPRKVEITRDVINSPLIETESIGDVFVIRLYSFNANATTEFREALREFSVSKKKKLVLDLRGNPGGYLDAAVDISSWFLPAGKTVVSEDFGAGQEGKVFRSKGYNAFNSQLKMVVLIDGGSASAAEIVAGALKEHGIAKLVGEQSFGKGSVQELIDITPDTALKVTIARWLTPNGNSISDGGLTPDVEVKFDADLFKEKNIDTQMQKAIELLK